MTDPSALASAPPGETFVRLEEVVREYRVGPETVRALDGLTLHVAHGEWLAIVGVSGSGKSTLLQLLGGLDTATAGRIEVDGDDLAEVDLSEYRRSRVGFVFQSFHLVPSFSAIDNVTLALTFQGRSGRSRKRIAEDALSRVGLADRIHHRPGQLSGGEQQRVAIARATVHHPPLILADEPTGNLDRESAESVLSLLEELRHEGATVVMVTHDEPAARRHATRLIRLEAGRVQSEESVVRGGGA